MSLDLEAIKKRSVSARQVTLDKPKTSLYAEYYADDVPALIAEIERLQADQRERDADRLEAGRKVMEAAAKICRPGNQRKCSCIQQFESGVYYQECDCHNGGDLAEAQSWCEAANLAQAIERLDLPTILGIKGDGNE